MSKAQLRIVSTILVAAIGCGADGSNDELSADEQGVGEQAIIDEPANRADFRSELLLHEGWYGDTWSTSWCPEGTYAGGFSQRVERSQGGGDDTALNAIRLYCKAPGDARTTLQIEPHPGEYGDYSNVATCATRNGSPQLMIGGSIKLEGKQGGDHWYKPFDNSHDDTAANSVRMQCESGVAVADREGKWGEWYPQQTCPTNTAVCGISVRVEPRQGKKDDTGLNGVKLYCCER
ncbi:MAG: hypothetical protein RLZZ450_622 [Pseudomonadota bacterium]|jgi:hypothetical protein